VINQRFVTLGLKDFLASRIGQFKQKEPFIGFLSQFLVLRKSLSWWKGIEGQD